MGAGQFGRNHCRVARETERAELAAIVDIDQARAEEASAAHGGVALTAARELAGRVDAAIVAVPTSAHEAVACALLEAGIDVLVEKPIAVDAAAAGRIIDSAGRHGRVLQVGHLERFNPAVLELERRATLPLFFEIHRLNLFSPRSLDVDVVLDLMIHDIGIVLELVRSPITRIDSVGVNVLSRTEDIANARIEFAGGCVANLSASRMSLKKVREIRVFQASGYFSFDFMNQSGHLVRKSGMLAYAAQLRAGTKPGGLALPVEEIPLRKGEPLALELAAFVDSVARFRQPKVGGALGKTALEVAIAITEQIRKPR